MNWLQMGTIGICALQFSVDIIFTWPNYTIEAGFECDLITRLRILMWPSYKGEDCNITKYKGSGMHDGNDKGEELSKISHL